MLEQRYYDPALGRFISQDPLGVAAGVNLYGYSDNDPVNAVDPTGLWVTPADGAVILTDLYFAGQSAAHHDTAGLILNGGLALGDAFLTSIPGAPPAFGEARLLELVAGRGAAPYLTLGRFVAGNLLRGVYNAQRATGEGCGADLSRTVELGHAGEEAVGGSQNQNIIESESGTAKFRRPDRLTADFIGEIKNVKRLGLTKQLRDYIAFSKKEGIPFHLTVRENTRIYGPLQEAAERGDVTLFRTLPR